MLVKSKKEVYHLQLSSKPESIILVDEMLNNLNKKYIINQHLFANISTVLNEAVCNAIYHGNKLNTEKKVTIWVNEIGGNILSFVVSDEGKGFDYSKLQQPTLKQNIQKLTGRGVFIMQHLAQYCKFNIIGNAVELQFLVSKN